MIKKVLVINKYHFISGGAERYFLSILEALRRRGIETIPLSVNYKRTLPTPYQKYFLEPVGAGEKAKIRDQKFGLGDQWRLAKRAIWSAEAKEAVRRIWRDERPDLAYLLNINNHLSPSVIDGAKQCGMPVVMRMSDFNLVCASSMYFRAGKTCTACKGGFHHAFVNRCVHGSVLKSGVAALASAYYRTSGVYRKIDAFVTPSLFMRNDLIEQGFPAERIHQINTFVAPNEVCEPDLQNPYILFHGRFIDYKGAGAAIQAFARSRSASRVKLCLVGDEGDEDSVKLKELAARTACENVIFFPFERDKAKLIRYIQGSLFTLVPSINFENLPHTILESFSCGRPVISTRLGSIPETVHDGENGFLYDLGDLDGFAAKIDRLVEDRGLRESMGENAYRAVRERYSEDAHVEKLIDVFEGVVSGAARERTVHA